MKKLLTMSVLCIITTVNATNLGLNLLESSPKILQQQLENAKESADKENAASKKVVHAKTQNNQHKKANKKNSKHGTSNYDPSYDVNEVFSQQQEQANRIMAKTNQINIAAQKVARDASIQAQKTQDLLKAQKEAQASANAMISSANELNKLSMSLQKNISSNSIVESSTTNVSEAKSFNN